LIKKKKKFLDVRRHIIINQGAVP